MGLPRCWSGPAGRLAVIACSRPGAARDCKYRGSTGLKGRLWLNDGSCIRFRPTHRNQVWSYDFVEAQTHDGRRIRLMTLIDEYTRECLAIRVARRINSLGVVEAMADAMLTRGIPEHIRSDNGAEMTAKVVLARLGTALLYIEPDSPWENGYCESFNQRQTARRMSEPGDLLQLEGSKGRHRVMEQSIQHDPAALILELSAASTPNIHSPIASPGSQYPMR